MDDKSYTPRFEAFYSQDDDMVPRHEVYIRAKGHDEVIPAPLGDTQEETIELIKTMLDLAEKHNVFPQFFTHRLDFEYFVECCNKVFEQEGLKEDEVLKWKVTDVDQQHPPVVTRQQLGAENN